LDEVGELLERTGFRVAEVDSRAGFSVIAARKDCPDPLHLNDELAEVSIFIVSCRHCRVERRRENESPGNTQDWTRWETKSGTSSQVIGSSYRRSPPTGRRRPHSAGIPRRPGAARRMEVFAEFFHINLTDYNLAHLLGVCPWRRGSCSRTCSVPGLWAPRTLTSGSGRSGCPQLPVQE